MFQRSLFTVLAILTIDLASVRAEPADPKTLTGKVVCGYQGWFFAAGDGNDPSVGWPHWSRDPAKPGPDNFCFEMWPDVSEYAETFTLPNTELTSGQPARVFSAATPSTVDKHFEWMEQYGIDGVFLQRFVFDLRDPTLFQARNKVLANVRAASKAHGRIYAVEYDLSSCDADIVYEQLTNDWKYLNDELHITKDPNYLHHNGKPVVIIWGLGYTDKPFTPEVARRIQDFFKDDAKYGHNWCIGGVPWGWRSQKYDSGSNAAWADVYRRWNTIHPWVVGAYKDAEQLANFKKQQMEPDMAECKKLGINYLPVVWPGFSWDNLHRHPHGKSNMPRRGGQHLWDQVYTFKSLGAESLFLAMFDELDEGTAIMKVSDDHPTIGHWITNDGMPKDWYMRLAGAARKMIRGEIPLSRTIPIESHTTQPSK